MNAGTGRRRADLLLVERRLFESRARAQEAIAAGLVTCDGTPVRKASDMLPRAADLRGEPPHSWVSRGGVKLRAGLDAFAIRREGKTCLDVGASTGGFTQVLLAAGAWRVYAVDVGHGQLHPSIASDARVRVLEQVDARKLDHVLVPDAIELVVVDVSFISLKLVLPPLSPVLSKHTQLIALVKPQFEAGRAAVGRGGVIRDEAVHRAVLSDLAEFASEQGWMVIGTEPSPITGRDGNREFLLGARRG